MLWELVFGSARPVASGLSGCGWPKQRKRSKYRHPGRACRAFFVLFVVCRGRVRFIFCHPHGRPVLPHGHAPCISPMRPHATPRRTTDHTGHRGPPLGPQRRAIPDPSRRAGAGGPAAPFVSRPGRIAALYRAPSVMYSQDCGVWACTPSSIAVCSCQLPPGMSMLAASWLLC